MVRSSRLPTSTSRDHSDSRALLQAEFDILESQGDQMHPQVICSSVISPQAQYIRDMNLLGDMSNSTYLFNQTLEHGRSNSAFPCSSASRRGTVDAMPKDADFHPSTVSFEPLSSMVMKAFGLSGQTQNQQVLNPVLDRMLPDQQKYHVWQQQQQHIQSSQGGLGGTTPVRFQPQHRNAHNGPHQHLSSLHNLGPVKLEQTQETGIGPVKWEHQHSDEALQELRKEQQLLQWSMQSSQNVSSHLNPYQQNILHQQQLLKALPQQRPQLQRHFHQKNLLMCTQRLSQYISQQQNRPNSNSIDFWNKFVAEFFTPNAKKRWCLSLYQNSGKVYGAFNQDTWNCELCNCRPGRGFEATFEALPRLFKMKYDSGTLEELLSVDMPSRDQNISGYIILEYAKVTQESVFEQLRVAHDGQLRIVFSPDLKICLWEFCARSHDVLISRRSIMPAISKLEDTARNYQSCALGACSNESMQDLEMKCDAFVKSACELEKALEVPSVLTKIGYMQDFGRCLQISDTFCRMRGLIDYSHKTGKGPIESYENLLRHGLGNSAQKPVEKQQNIGSSESNANANANLSTSANAGDGFLHKRLKKSPLEDQMMKNPNAPRVKNLSTGSSSNNPSRAPRRNNVASRAADNYKGEVNSPAQTQLPPSSKFKEAGRNEPRIYVRKIKRERESSPQ